MQRLTLVTFALLVLVNFARIQDCKELNRLIKRQRFSDPNLNFERTSKKIDRLIQILKKGTRKVNEQSVFDEISDIVREIKRFSGLVDNVTDKRPTYWYSRQG